MVVAAVEPHTVAAAVGLAPDDVIVAANGVRTFGFSDLVPPPGAPYLTLTVQHAFGPEETRSLPLARPRDDDPTRFALPATIAALMALVALWLGGAARSTSWLRRRLRVRPSFDDAVVQGCGAVLTATAVCMAPRIDVGVAAVVLFTSMLAVEVIVDSWRGAASVLARSLPTAIGLGAAMGVAGSFRADELAAAQGALPWEFFALRSPAHSLLLASCLAWVLFTRSDEPARLRTERLASNLLMGIVVVAFLGGGRLPQVAAHPQGIFVWVTAGVLGAKTVCFSAIVFRLRRALPSMALGKLARASCLRLAPIAVVAGLGALCWERSMVSHGAFAVTAFVSTALVVATMTALWPSWSRRPRVDPLA
jgi:hypothetical protein